MSAKKNALIDWGKQRVTIQENFENIYKKEPQCTAFTPYRICPIGAHSDHQLGKITGFAIDKGIHIAYGPKENGVVEIQSLQFEKRAQWHVEATPAVKENDWADHLRGATIALQKRYPLRRGLCAVIDGELPIGGAFFFGGGHHHLFVGALRDEPYSADTKRID